MPANSLIAGMARSYRPHFYRGHDELLTNINEGD
jgi:hypothetical protein